MRVEYGKVADSVYFRLRGEAVAESVEISAGVVIDYDSQGEICGIEENHRHTQIFSGFLRGRE